MSINLRAFVQYDLEMYFMDYCSCVLVLPLTLVPSRPLLRRSCTLGSFLSQPISDDVRTLCVMCLRCFVSNSILQS